jgi:hypothetical protein
MPANNWIDHVNLGNGRYRMYNIKYKLYYLFDKHDHVLGTRKTVEELIQFNKEV